MKLPAPISPSFAPIASTLALCSCVLVPLAAAQTAPPAIPTAKFRGRVQLNIRNLLDRRRYEEVNLSQTRYEAPRSLSLTSSLSF